MSVRSVVRVVTQTHKHSHTMSKLLQAPLTRGVMIRFDAAFLHFSKHGSLFEIPVLKPINGKRLRENTITAFIHAKYKIHYSHKTV